MIPVGACLAGSGVSVQRNGSSLHRYSEIGVVRESDCRLPGSAWRTCCSPAAGGNCRTACSDHPRAGCDGRLSAGAATCTTHIAVENGCKSAVLKARSPSCGSGRIYDGDFSGRLMDGDGLSAGLLKRGGITVYTEEEYAVQIGKSGGEFE